MLIIDKIVMSDTPPKNKEVLWLYPKGDYKFILRVHTSIISDNDIYGMWVDIGNEVELSVPTLPPTYNSWYYIITDTDINENSINLEEWEKVTTTYNKTINYNNTHLYIMIQEDNNLSKVITDSSEILDCDFTFNYNIENILYNCYKYDTAIPFEVNTKIIIT